MNANATTRPFRSTVVLTLLVALTLVMLPPSPPVAAVEVQAVEVQAVETPAPVNPLDLDPLMVSLKSSAPEFAVGSSVTLTATSSVPVEQIGATLEIVEEGSGTVVKACTTGTTCSVAVSFYTGDPRLYVGRVGDVESAPVTVSRKPWTVSLTSSMGVFGAGERFTLSAVANQDTVGAGGSYVVRIVDVTTGVVVTTCPADLYNLGGDAGFGCSISTTFHTGGPHEYVAYVSSSSDVEADVQAQSSSVTVSRKPWTVSLTTSADVFAAGTSFRLSAVVNQETAWTGGSYAVHIVDVTSGAVVKTCTNDLYNLGEPLGRECAVTTRFYTGGPHEYVAYVANKGDYKVDVQAQSSQVTSMRQPWTVSLTTSADVFAAGTSFRLSAVVNQETAWTGGSYAVHIVDVTTGAIVKTCANDLYNLGGSLGRECAVSTRFYTGEPHQYVAYVASAVASPSALAHTIDVQAQSAPVTVSRKPWTVSLTTSADVFAAGTSFRLSAVVNQDTAWTGGSYAVHIVDVTTGAVVKTCTNDLYNLGEPLGRECAVTTKFYTGGPHEYVAYVSRVGSFGADIQATSNPVTTTRQPWTATMTVDKTSFSAGQSFTLNVTANQNVGYTGNNYSIFIVDLTSGTVVKECTTGSSCALTTTFYTGDPRSYQAFVASRSGGYEADRQASTNSVNVARAPWRIELNATSTSAPDADGRVTTNYTALANQNVGYTDGNYRIYIYDYTAKAVVKTCTAGVSCLGSVNAPLGYPHVLYAYVAGTGGPFHDQQAKSNGQMTQASVGALIPGETYGGSNPAQACASTCHADPINTQSGEFFETTTDIGLPGVGPNVSWTRTYSTQRAAQAGDFGFGWTANAGMSVVSADADPLAIARTVGVVQENGSTTTFLRTPDGTFIAPDRVFATLTYDPVDGYRYVRGGNEAFLFSPQGVLTRIEDNNGNGIDVTVNSSGKVTQLVADDGRALAVTYANGRVSNVADSTGREVDYVYDAAGNLVTVNGFGGTTSVYGYDANHRVVSMTKPGGGVTTNTYDAQGRVIEQIDPIGRSTRFEYLTGETRVTDNLGVVTIERYSNGQLTSATTAAGTSVESTVSYTYTSGNQVASMTDALGRVAYYSYDARGNRVWIINTLGAMTKFAYDANGYLVTVTNALNEVTTFENDAKGNPVAVVDALGNRTVNTLNEQGQVTAVTDALGRTSTVEYDAHGRPIAQVSAGGVRTEIEYDSLGMVTATVDPRGTQPGDNRSAYRSTYVYNALGLRTSATDPLGNSMTYAYDAAGRTTATTDVLGHATTVTYDAAGQILTTTDASGATTTFAYDGVGRATVITAPDGTTVRTVYDAAGRPTQSIDALGEITAYTYNKAGELLTETSPEGRVTSYQYDKGGHPTKITDPAGGVTTMAYDLLGRVTSVTDPDGRTTMTTYDAAGRVTQTRRSDGATESFVFDAAGQVTSSTDVNGRVTTYTYDADGNVVSSVDFAGRTTTATYVDGFPVVTTDAAGETTTSSYDARGLATGVSYSSGLAYTVVEHDALGRVTSTTDAAGETEYTYDVLNRVTAISGPTGDVSYAYNAAGNVQSVTYPSGRVVEREYDAAGRLTGVETDGVGAFHVAWTDDGLVDAVTYPNGVATDYSYDLAGRATGIATSGSAGDILELGYAYSPGSLVTSRSTSRSGGTPVSESVTWDAAARLSTISSMSSGVPVQYTPSSEVTRADDGAQLVWGADGSLTSRTLGAEVTTYASDLLGRRTSTTTASGDVASFAWDQVGRLTVVGDTVTGSQTDYTYSGGLRIGAATTTGDDTTSEAFEWDTLAGVPLLLSDAGYEFLYALGSAPVAQVDTATGAVTFLHGDLVGSTRAATDATGTVVGTWDYSTFGVTTTATGGAADDGAGVTRFLFAGEYLDDTGLYYLRARFYDPVTASFLSVDPALAQTGSPYAYTSGNPLQMVDPLGLWPGSGLFDSVKSAVSDTVDLASAGLSATGNWIADNKGMIIGTAAGIVIGGGCLLITAGAGSVGCAALGGAVASVVTYGIDTPRECWTAGGFFVNAAVGGLFGGLTAGAGNAVAPFLSKVVTAGAARATPALRGAISRVTTAFKPRASVLDDACAGGLCKAQGQCFVAGTGVLLADGTFVAIEDVEIGDRVLTTDPGTGVESAHAVTQLFRHDNAALFDVVIDGSTVTATPSHPFWVVGRGWVPVDQLDVGDQLLQPDDTTATVESVTATGKTATVYNFEVEGAHNYYVKAGDHWVLVHNDCSDEAWNIAMKAFDDHGADLGFASVDDMGQYVDDVMNSRPGIPRDDGSVVFIDEAQAAVVIRGPSAATPGTVYRPDNLAHFLKTLESRR